MFSQTKRQKLKNMVLMLDQFGSRFSFSQQEQSKEYRTIIGGIGSIVIYLIGLLYFLYLFSLFVSNRIPPNIYQISEVLDQDTIYSYREPIAAFQTILNPMTTQDPNRVFFIPKITNFINGTQIQNQQSVTLGGECSNAFSNKDLSQYFCLDCNKNKLNFYTFQEQYDIGYIPDNPGTQPYIAFSLLGCREEYLKPGQRCANADEMDQFYSTGSFHFIIFLSQFDYNVNTYKVVSKEYFFTPFKFIGNKFSLQLSQIGVDQNILIQDFQHYQTLSDVESSNIQFGPLSWKYAYPDDLVLNQYLFDLQPAKVQMSVQFKKIAAVLAEFQSLFSVLLILGYIFRLYADKLSEQALKSAIITRFYPKIKSPEINQILVGYINTLKLLLDESHFLNEKNVAKRLNLIELLKELVELRLLISLMLNQTEFTSTQDLGLSFDTEIKNPKSQIYNKSDQVNASTIKGQFNYGKITPSKEQPKLIIPPGDTESMNNQPPDKPSDSSQSIMQNDQDYPQKSNQNELNYLNLLFGQLNVQVKDAQDQTIPHYSYTDEFSFQKRFRKSLINYKSANQEIL